MTTTTTSINAQMIEATAVVANNSASINDLAGEYQNSACEVDAAGDVWDARGHWWSDDRKAEFLAWLAKR